MSKITDMNDQDFIQLVQIMVILDLLFGNFSWLVVEFCYTRLTKSSARFLLHKFIES